MSFVSSKGNILCRLIKIELYKIFAIINRAIKGLHCMLAIFLPFCPGANDLTHWGRDKMAAIFQCIFVNENVWISIEISLNFVPSGPTDNIPALVQMMAWRRPGDKPLSEPMMVILLTHICVTRPQWVNSLGPGRFSSTCISKYVIFKHFVMSDTCKTGMGVDFDEKTENILQPGIPRKILK